MELQEIPTEILDFWQEVLANEILEKERKGEENNVEEIDLSQIPLPILRMLQSVVVNERLRRSSLPKDPSKGEIPKRPAGALPTLPRKIGNWAFFLGVFSFFLYALTAIWSLLVRKNSTQSGER